MLIWVIVLGSLVGFRRIRFANRRTALVAMAALVVSVAPVVIGDEWLLQMSDRMDMNPSTKIAAAPSPDGLKRVTAFQRYFQDAVAYRLELEENKPWPLSATDLVTFYLIHGDLAEDARYAIVWSRDSQVVLLQCEGRPVVACDFATGAIINEPWQTHWGTEKGAKDFAAFQVQIDALMREHGGLAP
jgi:hypothetical protein